MAPLKPFGRGGRGYTSLDKRRADAQAILARAWRGRVASRVLRARQEEAGAEQRRKAFERTKLLEARQLAETRRAEAPFVKKKKAYGKHLKNLAGVLPSRGFDQLLDAGGMSPIYSPICHDSMSTRWLTIDGASTGANFEGNLSVFQQAEFERVRSEYKHSRAFTPSHISSTWTQAMRTKSSRAFMSYELQAPFKRQAHMLIGRTGVGASGCGATPDSRSAAPLWIEPHAYQMTHAPPNLQALMQACAPSNHALLASLLQKCRWIDVAELLAMDAHATPDNMSMTLASMTLGETVTPLSSSAWAAFALCASKDAILQKHYTQALMLLRLANASVHDCTPSSTPHLSLIEQPLLRGHKKQPYSSQQHLQRFLLSPTFNVQHTSNTTHDSTQQHTQQCSLNTYNSSHGLDTSFSKNRVLLSDRGDEGGGGGGEKKSGKREEGETGRLQQIVGTTPPPPSPLLSPPPTLQAYHADLMALYLHRTGKDSLALKW